MRSKGTSKGRHLPALGLATCALLFCLSDAAAQEAPVPATPAPSDLPGPVLTKSQLYRTLTLRDGSKRTGRLVEFIPSKRITILLADGSAKTLDLAEVVRIDPVLAPKPPPAPPPPVVVDNDNIRVQLTADRPVTVWSVTSNGRRAQLFSERKEYVLLVPWSNTYEYEIDGPDTAKSSFRLLAMPRQRVEIRAGSKSTRSTGLGLLVLGVVSSASGLVVLFFGGIASGVGPALNPDYQVPLGVWVGGGVGLGVGALGIIAGAIIMTGNSTHLRVIPDDGLASLRLSTGIRLSARGLEF